MSAVLLEREKEWHWLVNDAGVLGMVVDDAVSTREEGEV